MPARALPCLQASFVVSVLFLSGLAQAHIQFPNFKHAENSNSVLKDLINDNTKYLSFPNGKASSVPTDMVSSVFMSESERMRKVSRGLNRNIDNVLLRTEEDVSEELFQIPGLSGNRRVNEASSQGSGSGDGSSFASGLGTDDPQVLGPSSGSDSGSSGSSQGSGSASSQGSGSGDGSSSASGSGTDDPQVLGTSSGSDSGSSGSSQVSGSLPPNTHPFDTCEGASAKLLSVHSACPQGFKWVSQFDVSQNKTVQIQHWERTPASCGNATACPAAISSITDMVLSAMKTGFADCAGKPGFDEYSASKFLSYGFVRDYVGACGLPASTVKVTLNLTTCVGAVTLHSIVSIDRACPSGSCGPATACPAAISSITDTVLSDMKTGFADCLTATGVPKSGYEEWAYTAQYALNAYGIELLTSRARECGLPASTVKLSPPASNTCEGVMYKIQSVDSACPTVYIGKWPPYFDVSQNKTVQHERWERTPASCGNATACPAAISSITDTVLSDMKTGFADCFTASGVLKTGYGWAGTSPNALNNYFQSLTSRARECGLPASTVKLSPPSLDTCEGVMYKIQSVDSACPTVYIGKWPPYFDVSQNKTVQHERWERTPASCGNTTACPAAISSISDTVLSAMKTRLADCAGKPGFDEYSASKFLSYGFVRDYVGACGLPASTVKVTLNLTTCVGAVTLHSIVSIDRACPSGSCGPATACPAAISSITDTVLSDMKTGFADCLTATGVPKSGYEEWAYTAQYALNANAYGILRLTSRARECGLPASTVKLSPPASNTCEGVMYKIQSVDSACPSVNMSYVDLSGNTVYYDEWKHTPASCGNATACPAAISSFNDTVLSDMKTVALADCFTASGVPKSGYEEWAYTAQYVFQSLTSRARECGLPASTVKLSPPSLDTCEGVKYKIQSVDSACPSVFLGKKSYVQDFSGNTVYYDEWKHTPASCGNATACPAAISSITDTVLSDMMTAALADCSAGDYSSYVLGTYFQSLTSRARECGLPASTVKLSAPALDTCAGAGTWAAFMESACPGHEKNYAKTPASCGTAECASFISSFNDTMMSAVMTGFSKCAGQPGYGGTITYMDIFNFVNDTASKCGLPPSTVKLSLPSGTSSSGDRGSSGSGAGTNETQHQNQGPGNNTHPFATCEGSSAKLVSLGSACPGHEKNYAKTPASCGTAECASFISSFNDTMMSAVMTGFSKCAGQPGYQWTRGIRVIDILNYLKVTASQCGLPASTVNLTAPKAGGGDGWPWPRAAAAENFLDQGEKTICSPGCKNSMLGSKEHVLQRTSGILSDCDLECMTPECGYDFGACDDEIGGLNKLDFDVYLDSIRNKQTGNVSFDDIRQPRNCTGSKLSREICHILRTASFEEYKMADMQGDGLSSFEAFALYMMKIQTCNEDETLPEGIKLNCKAWHDVVLSHVGIALLNMAFRDEIPTIMRSPRAEMLQYPDEKYGWNPEMGGGSWKTWQRWHPKNFSDKFEAQAKDFLPTGQPLTIGSLAQWIADIYHLYAGETDKETWEPEAVRSYVDWTIDFADADHDGKMSRAEGYILGFSRVKNDLFHWLDMDSDGFVTKKEGFTVYKTIITDGNKGKFVCNGLEIIDATHGKIDIRVPMGVDGYACGWLILPSWFYADDLTQGAASGSVASDNRRRKAASSEAEDTGFVVSFGYESSSPKSFYHVCSGALISPDAVLTTASCLNLVIEHDEPTVRIHGESNKSFTISDVFFHPSVNYEMAYDVAVVKLDATSLVKPVRLYDGGDLGIIDCDRMKLSYLQWVIPNPYSPSNLTDALLDHKVRLLDHKDCQEWYHNLTGSSFGPDELTVGPQDICVVKADVLTGPCTGDIGLPLTAKVKGTNERVLLGLATNNNCANGLDASGSGSNPSGSSNASNASNASNTRGSNSSGSSNASNASNASNTTTSNATTFVFVETTALFNCTHNRTKPNITCQGGNGTVNHSSAASGSGSGDEMLRLPAVFTRVSSSFQWILSTVPALSRHPNQFTLELNITQLGIPEGARVSVYHEGGRASSLSMDAKLGGQVLPSCADAPNKNCEIDSNCDVPVRILTRDGTVLLVLEMPNSTAVKKTSTRLQEQPYCNEDCMKTLGLEASFNLVPCDSCTGNCSMSRTWSELRRFEQGGKAYTGGLGTRMVRKSDVEYGVWSCVRDWDEQQQLACGARHNELACFWFEEKSRKFHFRGLNDETRLVLPEEDVHGKELEALSLLGRTLSTSKDQAHVQRTV